MKKLFCLFALVVAPAVAASAQDKPSPKALPAGLTLSEPAWGTVPVNVSAGHPYRGGGVELREVVYADGSVWRAGAGR